MVVFVVVACGSLLFGVLSARAALFSSTTTLTYLNCSFYGASQIDRAPYPDLGEARTYRVSGTCDQLFDVHAYFFDGNLIEHYGENQRYWSSSFPGASIPFPWYTVSMYGYHKYPFGSPTTWETHAY